MTKWRYEFSDGGGYDSMSHAFYIYAGEKHVATLDLTDFGEHRWWDHVPGAKERAQECAELIVSAVNARLKVKRPPD